MYWELRRVSIALVALDCLARKEAMRIFRFCPAGMSDQRHRGCRRHLPHGFQISQCEFPLFRRTATVY